ncbi:hypothetical protein PAHAL_3G279800 [Panicum hallii]|uniref:Uncharacterized protein n=1 Tax=Panicum hallii TaxID=206008 RepID=A0A2T8KJM0_9POAL|nr:hypothetical protein PAHAL_3G279800 [Panicum hallii]
MRAHSAILPGAESSAARRLPAGRLECWTRLLLLAGSGGQGGSSPAQECTFCVFWDSGHQSMGRYTERSYCLLGLENGRCSCALASF